MTTLDHVKTSGLVPPKFQRDWFIAGGYAACHDLATDLDLWIQVSDPDQMSKARMQLLMFFDVAGFTYKEQEGSAELNETEYNEEGEPFVYISKVAEVTAWRGIPFDKPVHVLVTSNDVHEILNHFDISTHQVAMLPSGEFVYGEQWTPLDVAPVILKDTPSTAERFIKIAHRYRDMRPSSSPCVGS